MWTRETLEHALHAWTPKLKHSDEAHTNASKASKNLDASHTANMPPPREPAHENMARSSSFQYMHNISIDTRTLQPGDVYMALDGAHNDGHDYCQQAIEKGASLVVVERDIEGISCAKQLRVSNTHEALGMCAKYARYHTSAHIVAVTGSSGKTTVKDWLSCVLKSFGETVVSKASYNNHIGVPLSLTFLRPQTTYGIFEAGTSSFGEIFERTTEILPHVAIITSIGESHLAGLGSLLGVAEEKSDIFLGLSPNGAAILPYDTPYFDQLYQKARALNIKHIYTFGKGNGADARLLEHHVHQEKHTHRTATQIKASICGDIIEYNIPLPGEHSVINSLAILLTCHHLNLPLSRVKDDLSTLAPVKGRGITYHLVMDMQGAPHTITLIDDAYNANPASMRAGLTTLSVLPCTKDARKIAVLGDMKELGEHSAIYHQALATLIRGLDIHRVFTLGPEMKALHHALPPSLRGAHSEDPHALFHTLSKYVRPQDVLFVKGSKSSYTSHIVNAFLKCAISYTHT